MGLKLRFAGLHINENSEDREAWVGRSEVMQKMEEGKDKQRASYSGHSRMPAASLLEALYISWV